MAMKDWKKTGKDEWEKNGKLLVVDRIGNTGSWDVRVKIHGFGWETLSPESTITDAMGTRTVTIGFNNKSQALKKARQYMRKH